VAITQVGSTTNTGNAALVASRAPAVPTGAASGDVAIVHLDVWESIDPAITTPAGFSQVYKNNVGGGFAKSYCFRKTLTGSDSGTYSFSWTGSMWAAASCTMLRGVKSGDPIGSNFDIDILASGTTFPSTSVSPGYVPALLWHGFNDSPGTHAAPTSPSGFTETADVDCAVDAIYLPSSGTSFTVTGGTTTVSSPLTVGLVAVEADAGGPPPTAPTLFIVRPGYRIR
jgi:hypothetical protein